MLKEKFDLTGKTAPVTGSTRGIGKAIGAALLFASGAGCGSGCPERGILERSWI